MFFRCSDKIQAFFRSLLLPLVLASNEQQKEAQVNRR
jgi:hypothetical protein